MPRRAGFELAAARRQLALALQNKPCSGQLFAQKIMLSTNHAELEKEKKVSNGQRELLALFLSFRRKLSLFLGFSTAFELRSFSRLHHAFSFRRITFHSM